MSLVFRHSSVDGLFEIAGQRVFFTDAALRDSQERLFPVSPHRSRRIHKKLLKRFGSEFRKEPCIAHLPTGWIVHPALKAELLAAMEKASHARP